MGKSLGNLVPLQTRGRLAFKWTPENVDKVLDIGCSYGYFTAHFLKKARKVYGVDINRKQIEEAKKNYPEIEFKVGKAEKLPFEDEMFDIVLMNDVFEHVDNEVRALNELYRVLKKDGLLIFSVPNKGLFSFLDVDNFRFNFPRIFRFLYRKVKGMEPIDNSKVNVHRHYSLNEIKEFFKNKFKIERVKRSTLFLYHSARLVEIFFERLLGRNVLKPVLLPIEELDYWIRYGRFAGSMMIRAKKLSL